MRKVLSVFLAVVLCVLLCACGVDKKYNAILEYFDSGNYEGIKSEMMVLSPEFKALNLKRNVEAATALGKLAGEKAAAASITTVVFDRGGFQYHGRVKALADAAREAGLKF